MTPAEIITMALILSAGTFTQSATGFAGGLVIIPLMLGAGHGVPEAQAALVAATLPQNVLGVRKFWHTEAWRALPLPLILRTACIPLGVATLVVMDAFPQELVRQIIGGVIIFCVTLLLVARPRPQTRLPQFWTWLAFPCAGFFAGCTGIGGPFMVLWVQAHDWTTEKIRGFLFCMYLAGIPLIGGLLLSQFGQRVLLPMAVALALTPLLLLVTSWGLRVGSWLGRERLRRLTLTILLWIGVLGILGPWWSR